jgi:hypothetical protein
MYIYFESGKQALSKIEDLYVPLSLDADSNRFSSYPEVWLRFFLCVLALARLALTHI